MGKVLHLPGDDETRWMGFRYLILSLNPSNGPYVLSTANALWVQEDYPVDGRYLWIIREFYRGEARSVDFKGDSEGAERSINGWVENKTKGRVKNLAGYLTPDTMLIITNAVYFKANWSSRFDPSETRNGTFKTPGGTVVVPMMHGKITFNYTENDKLQTLEMPYEGKRLSMVIILPKKADGLKEVEGKLCQGFLEDILRSLKPEEVEVAIPKFRFEASYSLKMPLIDMGRVKAFSRGADFSGITDAEGLFIGDVVHKTFISVAENGTEAAAATAVVVLESGPPGEESYKVFKADHPFLFLIVDRETNAVLFMGRVMNTRS